MSLIRSIGAFLVVATVFAVVATRSTGDDGAAPAAE
jgi:hypothetical protein